MDAFLEAAVRAGKMVLAAVLVLCLMAGILAGLRMTAAYGLAGGLRMLGLIIIMTIGISPGSLLDLALLCFMGCAVWPLISRCLLVPMALVGLAKGFCEFVGNAGLSAQGVLLGRMVKQSGKE